MKKILLGSTALVAAGMIASAPASAKNEIKRWRIHGAVGWLC